MLDREIAQRVMQREGIRITPQRMAVVDVLTGNTSHPTVDEIFLAAREKYPMISLATVYNTVTLFIKQGLLLELHGDGNSLRCDPNTEPHAHAYCLRCGAVLDFTSPVAEIQQMALPIGFRPVRLDISLSGFCADCTESSETSSTAYANQSIT